MAAHKQVFLQSLSNIFLSHTLCSGIKILEGILSIYFVGKKPQVDRMTLTSLL